MPEIGEVVWYLGLEWCYEIGCSTLRSTFNSSAAKDDSWSMRPIQRSPLVGID